MKNKLFQRFALIWLICFAAFNVVLFVVPTTVLGYSRLTGAFWTGYAFITLAFLGQLACGWFALKADSLTKLFYNMPLLTVCHTGLFMMLVIGSLFMVIPVLPVWLGVILCFLVLTFTAIAVIKANTAAELVHETDEKVRRQTSTMRELTMQAESLMLQAKSEEARAECQKVYEALHYSDPMSNDALISYEDNISNCLTKISKAIYTDDQLSITEVCKELISIIQQRNILCQRLK
ncbi:MAG: hypothetical protein IJI57_10090 [Flexilinea sp.]|nr:hypothetical protein [Flexilinea sp.]